MSLRRLVQGRSVNRQGALWAVRCCPGIIVHTKPRTTYQLGLRRDHVLAFHPTRDRHRGTIFRLTMEFRSTKQLLSFVRLGTLLYMCKGGRVGNCARTHFLDHTRTSE